MKYQIKVTLSACELEQLMHLSNVLGTKKFNKESKEFKPNYAATLRRLIATYLMYENDGRLFDKAAQEDIQELSKTLRGFASNINQIAHVVHTQNLKNSDKYDPKDLPPVELRILQKTCSELERSSHLLEVIYKLVKRFNKQMLSG